MSTQEKIIEVSRQIENKKRHLEAYMKFKNYEISVLEEQKKMLEEIAEVTVRS